jgi:hypothetical protein
MLCPVKTIVLSLITRLELGIIFWNFHILVRMHAWVFACYEDSKTCHNVVMFSASNLKILGTWLKKEQWSKGVVKGGSHFNLSLYCEISANKNDFIILWNTFVTCSCLSHNHYFIKGLRSNSFSWKFSIQICTLTYIWTKNNLPSKKFQINFKSWSLNSN